MTKWIWFSQLFIVFQFLLWVASDVSLSQPKQKYPLELTIILISPDGSNDLPHFAMLIRLYDTLLTSVVLYISLLFFNYFCSKRSAAYFCFKIIVTALSHTQKITQIRKNFKIFAIMLCTLQKKVVTLRHFCPLMYFHSMRYWNLLHIFTIFYGIFHRKTPLFIFPNSK